MISALALAPAPAQGLGDVLAVLEGGQYEDLHVGSSGSAR
jgi:hypothetical protein